MGRPKRTQSWLVVALLALSAPACGNEPEARTQRDAQPARTATLTVPSGTTFEVRTHTVLSTERNRPGDVLTAGLVGPLVDGDGTVIVPADAVVRARVTAVVTPTQADQPAVLSLAFEAISIAGSSYPLQATIEQVMGRTGISALHGVAMGHADGTPIAIEADGADAILPGGVELLVRVLNTITISRPVPGAP